MNKMFWIIPIIFLIVFETVADVFAKEYSLKHHWYLWVSAILFYIICNTFWLWGIKEGSGLARGSIIFSVASGIIAVVIGLYFYGEETNKFQLAGMLLGVLSLVLIFWE